MTGMTNYFASGAMNHLNGIAPLPFPTASFLGLFTAVGNDSGAGFTELAGNGYSRVQISGQGAAGAPFTVSSNSITMALANPGWIVPGMNVYDLTSGQQIGTVSSYVGPTLSLTANAAHGSQGAADNLSFSMFPQGSGTAPTAATNGGAVNFPTPTGGGWTTPILAWGSFDALTAGNLLFWDFLGAVPIAPFTSTALASGSGAVFTQHAHGFQNGTPVVCAAEFGGTLPTVTQGQLTNYFVNYAANVTTDTYTLSSSPSAPSAANAVWTSNSGNGQARSVAPFLVGNATASFNPANLSLSFA